MLPATRFPALGVAASANAPGIARERRESYVTADMTINLGQGPSELT